MIGRFEERFNERFEDSANAWAIRRTCLDDPEPFHKHLETQLSRNSKPPRRHHPSISLAILSFNLSRIVPRCFAQAQAFSAHSLNSQFSPPASHSHWRSSLVADRYRRQTANGVTATGVRQPTALYHGTHAGSQKLASSVAGPHPCEYEGRSAKLPPEWGSRQRDC
jgi:hypothetical protein